ncbi:hypothetical protein M409DRAFT_16450 [Zasmidium cellare ATCC 36951]|uniref:F-box domain-containing protein n=1 Tax=Zasmidium cellare ATCC 36951 TaxID=1080233 RepID=A0A6A6D793_ZASCE|nr:uncharacterized protein M409DRAFT_16450 [Zasmidium cellare ATCC 36951]KAF2174180.1 hypothetical protein M409DRAFT_16450 [Zasmidium cellare ATCC 36951]
MKREGRLSRPWLGGVMLELALEFHLVTFFLLLINFCDQLVDYSDQSLTFPDQLLSFFDQFRDFIDQRLGFTNLLLLDFIDSLLNFSDQSSSSQTGFTISSTSVAVSAMVPQPARPTPFSAPAMAPQPARSTPFSAPSSVPFSAPSSASSHLPRHTDDMTISQLIRSASASASSHPPPPQNSDTMAAFPFLDLPPEIRIMIYRELLVGDLMSKQIDTAILRASKQLKTEGEDVLYGENEVWGDLMVIDDDTVFRTHVPGILDIWGGIEPGRTTLIDHKIIKERRPLGAVMKVFSTIYAKFRRFRFNLWIDDCESER